MTEGVQLTPRAAVSPQALCIARKILSMSVELPVPPGDEKVEDRNINSKPRRRFQM